MLKDAVLAILQEAGKNLLLTDDMVRRRLEKAKPWLNPTGEELTEALFLIDSEHGTVTGIFTRDSEVYYLGIALKSKITAMPESCIMLVGASL